VRNNLVVFYYLAAFEIWPDKRGGLEWEWPDKRGSLEWEWPYKKGTTVYGCGINVKMSVLCTIIEVIL